MTNKECARISAFSSFVIRWSYEQSFNFVKEWGKMSRGSVFAGTKEFDEEVFFSFLDDSTVLSAVRVAKKKKELMTTSTDVTVVRGGAYTKEEDNRILELYEIYSTENNKWKLIASELKRGHKSVRERYVNHLDPTIDKSDLTIQEKHKIDRLQSIYMKKWAELAKALSNNRKDGRRTELQEKPDLNLKGLIPFPSSYL
ncbi:hypothetical protein RhiirA5_477608 [Rhizophagus irregularis]|uniref:Myb-like domain-containing protein n=3 Tax=Rhizophagus irregularis TaxID=588596 RepID=A0A2I1DZ97_9GLOM|nr:hypothetical protein GLOIN_2v1482753 [Rhizophagus irregularis DAOM 181602=DAOM 197198]PKC08295.1 hypothetical protein RhiirA5_477608 [Rhizophagus irregularis]PKC73190.1 hypothetical protein RhiirA1_437750 [Rhizophagus irregularis]PKY15203.1 hypothetical protein RhiirB3_466562 [Rhizophagus irregularis]POG65908.1 hypothetical protein GLOIN_2v1482753 [Rhizophagus irregularis DAOM 181602=DAOM 197198]|eukprot:XP_025172774.1 hypothetical protein GLOIN_2v1482753 [Rhizophagus irregularis DAOM 181602=DAOM 197198]